MSQIVTHESQHESLIVPSMTCQNNVQGPSSVQYNEQSMDINSVNNDNQDMCIQIDNYDYRLINALDLGLTPINDEDNSKLNKSMDVSTILFLFFFLAKL